MAEIVGSARIHAIIHVASGTAAVIAGVGMKARPDAVLLFPLQIGMVAAIAREHGLTPPESMLRSVVYATLGQAFGKGAFALLAVLAWVPNPVLRASVAAVVTG